MTTVRVGVIGLRFGSAVHVPAFRTDPRCVVAAMASRDHSRTEEVARQLGVPVAHADWRALLADETIDAVGIAVPPLEQAAIISAAARAGKHVFCEKPLAATVAEAEQSVAGVRESGVAHAIDFIFPEIPAWQKAHALLRAGAIGIPRHFSYSWRLQTFASRTRADSWKNRTAEGGGAAGNFLPHVIFNIEWLLGQIADVDSLPRRAGASAPAFCDCAVYLVTGVHGHISIATDAYLGGGHRVEICGDRGTLVLSNPTPNHADGFELSIGTLETGRMVVVQQDPPAVGGDGRIAPAGRIIRRFIDQIQGQACVRPNLEDGLHVQRWLRRISG